MTSIFAGSGLGLFGSSLTQTNGYGAKGNAALGKGTDQVYVNAADGNLVISNQDEFISAPGLSDAISRTYNSLGLLDGYALNHASLSFQRNLGLGLLTQNLHGNITRTTADGHSEVFIYNSGTGIWVAKNGSGAYDQIKANADGSYTYLEGGDGISETYNANGQLLVQTDQNGNTLTYTYNGNLISSQVITITDSAGQTAHIDYAGLLGTDISDIQVTGLVPGATSSSQTQTLTRVHYGYNVLGQLTTVTVELTPNYSGATFDSNVYTTTYGYDNLGHVNSIAQSDGTSLAITYQGVSGQVATLTDGLGRVTSFSYDTTNNATTVTDPDGNVTKYTYNAANAAVAPDELTRVDLPAVNGTTPNIQYVYDANGNISQVTDAAGRVYTYSYDGDGNLLRSQDSLGNTIDRTYDANDHLLSETQYTVADPDGAGSQQPSGALTTHYVYDSKENLLYTVSPDGHVSQNNYLANGERSSSIQYTGTPYTGSTYTQAALAAWVSSTANKAQSERTDYTYDLTGQVQTATQWNAVDSSGNGINDGKQSVSRYIYDVAGRLLTAIDPRAATSVPYNPTTAAGQAYVTSYTYDGLNRVTSVTDGTGRITTTAYNDAGRAIVVTLPGNRTVTSTDDADDNVLSVAKAGATGQALGTTTYGYDADGNQVSATDPSGQTTYTLYDARNRVSGTLSPQGELTEYVYNDDDQVIATHQYATLVTPGALNANGNLGLVGNLRPAASPLDRTTSDFYDAGGRLIYQVQAETPTTNTVTGFQYDAAGRKIASTQYAFNLATVPTSGKSTDLDSTVTANANASSDRTTRYFYDGAGDLTATLDPLGYLTQTVYDDAGEVSQTIAYANATPAANRASGTLASLIPASDPVNDQIAYTFYDGKGEVSQQIDAAGYLSAHSYDAAGNQTGQTRYATPVSYTAGGPIPTPVTSAQDQTSSALYDALNRVVTQTDVQGTISNYTYDVRGFLTSKTTAGPGNADARTVTYLYDDLGRPIDTLDGIGSAIYSSHTGNPTQQAADVTAYATKVIYDNDGHQIQTTDADGHSQWFYYDTDGRLAYTVDSAGDVTQTQYNAFGNVVGTLQYATPIATTGLIGGYVPTAASGDVNFYNALVGNAAAAANLLNRKKSFAYADDRGLETQSTDGNGFVTTDSYNAFGQLATEATDVGATPGAATRTDQYVYDARGELKQTTTDVGGIAAVSKVVSYDAFGRATQTQNPNGNLSSTQYDRLGRVVTVTDALGKTALASYDAFGRVLTRTDRTGNITAYTYNDATQTSTVTTPEGIVVSTTDNRYGQTLSVTDGTGIVTAYTYDADGNLKTTTVDPGTGTNPVTGQAYLNLLTQNFYDNADLLQTTVDARNTTTAYTYDPANRVLTRTVDPTGLNLITKYGYDAFSEAIQVTDPTGVVTETVFDHDGQSTAVIVDTAGLKLATTYTYDALGDQLVVAEGLQASGTTGSWTFAAAPNTTPKITQYTYDNLGRRTAQTVDPTGLKLTTKYVYDADGNVVQKTDANNNQTRYVYDADNNLRYTIDALGDVTENRYDGEGRVVTTIQYATRLTSTALTAITPSTTAANIAAIPATAGQDRTTRNVFDGDGRLAYSIDTLGDVTGYAYDNDDRVIDTVRYATPLTTAQLSALSANPSPLDILSALNGGIYTDGFNAGLSQYSYYPGSANGAQEINNQLDLTSQSTTSYTALLSNNTYDLSQTRVFRYEVTPQSSGGEFYIGADSSPSDSQNLLAHFSGSQIFAYNDNGGSISNTLLGNYTAGTTYVIEVAVTGTTSTLYVYQKGQPRASGYSKIFTITWPNIRARIEENQGGNQVAIVDNFALLSALPNSNPLDQHTYVAYDAAGRAVDQIDALNHLTANSYDGDGI